MGPVQVGAFHYSSIKPDWLRYKIINIWLWTLSKFKYNDDINLGAQYWSKLYKKKAINRDIYLQSEQSYYQAVYLR